MSNTIYEDILLLKEGNNMDYIVYLLGVTVINTILLALILNELYKINRNQKTTVANN